MDGLGDLVDGNLLHVATGFRFTEGPLWIGNAVLFSDIPSNRIVQWAYRPDGVSVATFRWPSGNANGNTLDPQGRLITCEHGGRRVSRTEVNGTVTVVADAYSGGRLNSPNDVVVRSDGTIYFTDPPYGLPRGVEGKEQDCNGVYRVSADLGTITRIAGDFTAPNGLCFSADESLLYVNDTQQRHIRVFDVDRDGNISNGRVFADVRGERPGAPDGMKIDADGRVYCTGPGGLWVFGPDGTYLAAIETPISVTNLAWGDADWRSLYITAGPSLFRIRMKTQGIALPAPAWVRGSALPGPGFG